VVFVVLVSGVMWEHVGSPGRITLATVEAGRTALVGIHTTTVSLTLKPPPLWQEAVFRLLILQEAVSSTVFISFI